MVRRPTHTHIGSHIMQQDQHIFYRCKKAFGPFYALFGHDLHAQFVAPCRQKDLQDAALQFNTDTQLAFVTDCEAIRKTLHTQANAKRMNVPLLENTYATLKFMQLKYRVAQ